MRVTNIRFRRTQVWVWALVCRGFAYTLGFSLIFVASYAAASLLNDAISIIACHLQIQTCIPMPGIDSLGRTFVEKRYLNPLVIQVLALAHVPPFLAIALMATLLRERQSEGRAPSSALIIAVIGLVIGAVYAAALFVLYNQPTGFDFMSFWDGRSSLFIPVPPLKAVDGTAIFGAVAALLIWRSMHLGFYNALGRMQEG